MSQDNANVAGGGAKVKAESPKLGPTFINDMIAQCIEPDKLIAALKHLGLKYVPTDWTAQMARNAIVNDVKAFLAKHAQSLGKDITKDPEMIEIANTVFETGLISSEGGYQVAMYWGAMDYNRLMQIQQQLFMQQGFFPGGGGFPGGGMPGFVPMNGGYNPFMQQAWQPNNANQSKDNKQAGQQQQPGGFPNFFGPMGGMNPYMMQGGMNPAMMQGGMNPYMMGGMNPMMGGAGGGGGWQQYTGTKAAANA